MIEQFKVLCRVKGLHEQNKLKILRERRAAVDKAMDAEHAQAGIVAQSLAELPGKEAVLFDAIMQTPVSVPDIDETKAKVLTLQEDHQKLEDEAERLIQVRIRCEKERDEARVQYQIAQRNLEKFTNIKTDLEGQKLLIAEAAEEAEIEDLFSKGQALII